MFSVNP